MAGGLGPTGRVGSERVSPAGCVWSRCPCSVGANRWAGVCLQNVWRAVPVRHEISVTTEQRDFGCMTLGIDVACRADHQATLAIDGKVVWSGRSSSPTRLISSGSGPTWTRPSRRVDRGGRADPQRVDRARRVVPPSRCPGGDGARPPSPRTCAPTTPSTPRTTDSTRRSWPGCRCCTPKGCASSPATVPPSRCADWSSSAPPSSSAAPRSTARLDALVELLGPAWTTCSAPSYGKSALELLVRYADPNTLIRLGRARLTRFLIRHSRGSSGVRPTPRGLSLQPSESLTLWGSGSGSTLPSWPPTSPPRPSRHRSSPAQIADLEERIANLYAEADPDGYHRARPPGRPGHRRPSSPADR